VEIGDGIVHIENRSYFRTVRKDTLVDGLEDGFNQLRRLEAEGKTSVLVAQETDGAASVLGWLTYTDTLRPDTN